MGNSAVQSSWFRRFLRGALWHSIGVVSAKFLMLLMNFVLARLFGGEGFGKVNFIQSTVNTAGSIASLGLNLAITKHVAQYKKSPSDLGGVISLSLVLAIFGGGVIGGGLIFFADQISEILLNGKEAVHLRLAGICVFFVVFSLMIANMFSGLEKFKSNSAIQIVSNLVMVTMVLTAGVIGGVDYSIYAMVIGYIATGIIYICVVWREIHKLNIGISLSAAKSKYRILYKYSLPAFLSGTIVTATTWFSHTVLIKNAGFEEFGIFSAANQFLLMISTLNGIIGTVLLPVYISNVNEGKKSRVLEVFNLGFAWSIAVLIGGMIIIFSDSIALLLGDDYQIESWDKIVSLVIFSAITIAHRQGVIRLILEHERLWLSLLGNIIWALSLILFLNIFISLGALGFAISLAAAYGLNAIIVNGLFLYLGVIPSFFLLGYDSIGIWVGVATMVGSPWINSSEIPEFAGFAISVLCIIIYWNRKRI